MSKENFPFVLFKKVSISMNDSLQTLNSKVLFWNTKQTEAHITTANKIQAHKRVVL